MASQGPNIPGTAVDDASVGTIVWVNPSNGKVSDDIYAVADEQSGTNTKPHYLKMTNFGFSIPTGATINGILVEIESKMNTGTNTWSTVAIVKGGVISSTIKSGAAGAVTTTEAYSSIPTSGATTDLWGETWTTTDINASNFGVVLSSAVFRSKTLSVDSVRITIYYTAAAATGKVQGFIMG